MEGSEIPPTKEELSSKHSPDGPTHDVVFGEITESWAELPQCAHPVTKQSARTVLRFDNSLGQIPGHCHPHNETQIGMGVLSIPTALDSLGIIPGVVCLCLIACICTWSNYIIGTFKLNHREVYGIDDAGALMLGRVGRGVLSVAF